MKLDKAFSPKRILCVAAHPDDLEFAVGGSVAKWANDGAEVFYLICTDGCKGSDNRDATREGLAKIRCDEQCAAAEVLGVKEVSFLGYEDGTTTVSDELKCDIVRAIRRCKPDTVFCIDPTLVYSAEHNFINHPDHRAVGQATIDAVFPLACDHMALPELLEEGLEPHKATTLLLLNMDKANFGVDISDYFSLKLDALAAHKSQNLSLKLVEALNRTLAESFGQQFEVELAEGFMRVDLNQ